MKQKVTHKEKEKVGLINNLKIMTQEVQVILTLEVDVTQSKQDIENFIKEIISNHLEKLRVYS